MPENTTPASPMLDHALEAVGRAGVVCRFVQRRLDDVRAMTKNDASPVTIADYASQAVVARHLRDSGVLLGGMVAEESAAFLKHADHSAHLAACVGALRHSGVWPDATPDDVIDAVELGAADPAVLNSNPGGWTLDPIDGTKGFLRGEQYCVSLAHIARGQVALGALCCPNLNPESATAISATGSVYSAIRTRGAKLHHETDKALIEFDVERVPLAPDHPARLAQSVETSHTRKDTAAEVMALAGPVGNPVNMDSQCKYALLARGDADVYLRLPSKRTYVERIWDHAAGSLLAQEAGCIVTDIRGRPLDFSRGRGLESNEGILGAPPDLHARLLKAIEAIAPPTV